MTARPHFPGFSSVEAASLRRVRRFAVPRWMIERATERRLAGDWEGACAAAGVDVTFDLADVAERHGDDIAAALADDLRHFAPDLLRWHLPRMRDDGRTTLDTETYAVVLARYHVTETAEKSQTTPYLYVSTPAMRDGPQRIKLCFRKVQTEVAVGVFRSHTEDWRSARHLWDVRHSAELRERCGGSTDRPPFFHSDGTPLDTGELPTADPGDGDPAARAEWVTLLHQEGDHTAAFAAAGIDLDLTPPTSKSRYYRPPVPEHILDELALNLTRLEPEVRRLTAEEVADRFLIAGDWRTSLLLEAADGDPGGRLRARFVDRDEVEEIPAPYLPEALWRRLPDLDLMRVGGVAPQHLHPLVGAALFPGLRGADVPVGPPGPAAPAPVRVRCRGEWHEVGFRPGGLLRMPHSDEEQQREQALRAFGGDVAGCFAVQQTWASGTGRLPKGLRAQRHELFLRAQHGDTQGVLELLDAGVDPRVRHTGARTLLHVLHLLDHEPLLPRLLAEGLDLEARDQRYRTPLFVAVNDGGSRALVEALVGAGARIDVIDETDLSLAQVIRKYKRTDLSFLQERVRAEYPDIGADWWDEWKDEDDEHWADEDDDEDEDN